MNNNNLNNNNLNNNNVNNNIDNNNLNDNEKIIQIVMSSNEVFIHKIPPLTNTHGHRSICIN